MATYIVNAPSGLTVGNFFVDSAVPGNVTRGTGADATAFSLTYTLANGRKVVVTGTGFTYDPSDPEGAPTAGLITGVQLFDGLVELATFYDVPNRSLVDFDARWLGNTNQDNDPNAVFNHLLPGDDTLIGSHEDDSFTPGIGNDIVDGGAGVDEVVYRGTGRPGGITVDLNFGDADDEVGAAWAGFSSTPIGTEFDTLLSIENVFGSNGNDLLIGDNHDNTFTASRGDDTIHGGGSPLTPDTDELRYDRGPGTPTLGADGIKVVFTAEGMGTVTANDGTTDPSTEPHDDFGLDTFTGIETIRGTREDDTFIGAEGTQRFRGMQGVDSYDGGAGDDEVDYSRDPIAVAGTGIIVDFVGLSASDEIGTATGVNGDTETLTNIEHIRGTINADSITGDDADNRFRGEGATTPSSAAPATTACRAAPATIPWTAASATRTRPITCRTP